MEMTNGEKKLHVWLYKYEQDGVSPVFEVDGSRQEVEYTINNSVDSLYTFCKLEFEVEEVTEAFTDFIQCKAHGHSHGHEHAASHTHSHGHEHAAAHTHAHGED